MKTVCVYHGIDLDGWMSAAIVKKWWMDENHMKSKETESLDFIGYSYGQKLPDLSAYDKIIMCDISFPKEEMSALWHNLNKQVIWIDHHISAINDNKDLVWGGETGCKFGIQDTKYAACELAWKFFFPKEEMPEIVRLLGRYDCFGHKGTPEEKTVLEFQFGARAYIIDYESAYSYLLNSERKDIGINILNSILSGGKSVYSYLCVDANISWEARFDLVLEQDGKYYKFAFVNRERFNPINFGIEYHKQGYDGCACFWYANGKWNFSLYNDNGEVDVSVICKKLGGGGHKGAAGFTLPEIDVFLSNIKK